MTLQKIEFEYDIPDGYRFVGYREAKIGEHYLKFGKIVTCEGIYVSEWPIVEKIPGQEQPAQNSKRHKHADLIHAWAEGAEIQILTGSKWEDVPGPSFGEKLKYRIKPKTKIVRFRSYLDRFFGTVKVVRSGVPSDLGTWLGDWQEVEVEE